MSTATLGAKQVYDRMLDSVGARGISTSKALALQDAVQHGLDHVAHYHPWTWRIRRQDWAVTAATPYVLLASSYESMGCAEIRRTHSDSVARTLEPMTTRDFHRAVNPTDATGTPTHYRITQRQVGSTYRYVAEVTPRPDGDYTWPDVEYYQAPPALAFSGSTGTVPEMPTEFYSTWLTASRFYAAQALGRFKLSQQFKEDLEEALADAVKRHDTTFQEGPPQGLEDPYGDWGAAC